MPKYHSFSLLFYNTFHLRLSQVFQPFTKMSKKYEETNTFEAKPISNAYGVKMIGVKMGEKGKQ